MYGNNNNNIFQSTLLTNSQSTDLRLAQKSKYFIFTFPLQAWHPILKFNRHPSIMPSHNEWSRACKNTSSSIPNAPCFFHHSPLPQLIRPSHRRYEALLQVKRGNNASARNCHTRDSMKKFGEAEHEWRLQSCPTQRLWRCRIVDRRCLQSS